MRRLFRITQEDRYIFRLAAPALGALAAEPLVALVDTAFVGRLGEEPLAALGVVTALLQLAFFVFIAIANAGTPLIARAVGAGDREKGSALVGQCLLLCAAAAAAGLPAVEAAAPLLVELMGAAPEVADASVDYLRIRALGLPALLVITAGHAVYRGVGDTRTPMYIAFGLSLVNLALDPLLIFGLGWGLAGAGAASVAAQTAGAAVFLHLLLTGRTGLPVKWKAPRWKHMAELVGAGSALFVRTLLLVATFTAAAGAAARLGVTEVAAHQVAVQVLLFLSLVIDSIAVAAQNLVASRLDTDRRAARRLADRMLWWGFVWGTALAVVFWLLRGALPGWFTNDPSVIAAAAALMPFVAATQPLNSVVFVFDGIMIGAAEFTFMAAAMAGAAALTCTLIALAGSLAGIWWALAALMAARLIPLALRYIRIVT